ncbi:MAG: hypothetical protein FJ363_04070 [Gemmatimonadetes bacterium]|nr:hypothetical protein [Gemmatimonadota bacterium]
MPVCSKCGKESHNQRMCPHCFAEYSPQDRASGRAGGAPASAKQLVAKLPFTPRMRWGLLGVLLASGIWFGFAGREREIPAGEVIENLVAAPMSAGEAEALVRRVRQEAKVETRGEELAVTFPAALWPQQRAGQLAAAQQFARAIEIVEGRKRTISFYDPSGSLYAKADAAGVVMVR